MMTEDLQLELQPDRVIVGDRLYYRPLHGAVEFPTGVQGGCVLIFGEAYRPTSHEVMGGVFVNTALEPFRSAVKDETPGPWRYDDDALIEIVDERIESASRALFEAIVDIAIKYHIPYFWCHSSDRELAADANRLILEIHNRRVGETFSSNWLKGSQIEAPVVSPIFAGSQRSINDDYLTSLTRSHAQAGLLRVSADCRNLLSQNPAAMKALNIAVYAGTAIRLRIPETRRRPGDVEEVLTYH